MVVGRGGDRQVRAIRPELEDRVAQVRTGAYVRVGEQRRIEKNLLVSRGNIILEEMGVEISPPTARLVRRQAESLAERLHVRELRKEPIRIEVLDVERPQRDIQLVLRPTEPALKSQEAVQAIQERPKVLTGQLAAVLQGQFGAVQRARIARKRHGHYPVRIHIPGVQ